jgi:hypothetical protein
MVRITFSLVSAADNSVLMASRFSVSAAELDKRGLRLYPPKPDGTVSPAEYNEKQAIVSAFDGTNNPFGFVVIADDLDGVYHDGEYMTMRVYAEKDCWFKILHVNAEGALQTLYPRGSRDNAFIRAGETRSIPDTTRFRMEKPYGEEYILAAAYTEPFRENAGGSERLSTDSLMRGIAVEGAGNGGSLKPAAFSRFSYTILP